MAMTSQQINDLVNGTHNRLGTPQGSYNLADFYTGNMTPPTRLPNGTLKQANWTQLPAIKAINTAVPGPTALPKDQTQLAYSGPANLPSAFDVQLAQTSIGPQGRRPVHYGLSSFLSGDPGEVDWSVVNPDPPGIGLGSLMGGDLTPAPQASGLGSLLTAPVRNTIYSNPTKYGATFAERQAGAQRRQTMMDKANFKSPQYLARRAEKRAAKRAAQAGGA